MVIKSETTQAKIKNLRVMDFFDDEFIGIIKKRFPDLSFQHFCMYIIDEKEKKAKEKFAISHDKIEDSKNNIITIDADNPESFEKFLKVVDEYVKKKEL